MARLLVAVGPRARRLAAQVAGRADVAVDHADAASLTDPDPGCIGVLADAEEGVVLAQSVHRTGRDLPVVFVASSAAQHESLLSDLLVTPGIGRHTRAVVAPDGEVEGSDPERDEALQVVVDEIERAELRGAHHRMMQRVRSELPLLDDISPSVATLYLGQLFEHAPIGILVVSRDGLVKAANPACTALLGWSPDQLRDMAVSTVFAGEAGDAALDVVAATAAGAGDGDPPERSLVRTGPAGDRQHVAVVVAPVDPGRPELGVIVLLRDKTDEVRALAAVEQARRVAEEAAERSSRLAATLQASLLPPDLPDIAGVELAACYHPAGDGSDVGGDFYDVFQVADGWLAALGDVCGKGAPAARLTALVRYTLRAAAPASTHLEDNLAALNRGVRRQSADDPVLRQRRFATMLALRFRPEGGRVVGHVASAGHLPPLIVSTDGSVREVECRGRLIGVFDEITVPEVEVSLAPGERMVMFTDGVTEGRRPRGQEFGDARLVELLRTLAGEPADVLVSSVCDAVVAYQGGTARDDIAVVVIGPSALAT